MATVKLSMTTSTVASTPLTLTVQIGETLCHREAPDRQAAGLDSQANLYWSNREGFALSTARTDGSGLRDLVKYDGSGQERDWIVGVALEEANRHIYWSEKGSAEGGDGKILRADIETPEGETAENRSDVEVLWDGLPAPIDL